MFQKMSDDRMLSGIFCRAKIKAVMITNRRDSYEGPVIIVSGIDMMNGTPIYDIKPYLPHVDCHPEALGGFSGQFKDYRLKVSCASEFLMLFPSDKCSCIFCPDYLELPE